jgi:hypothetical protein
MCTVKLLLSNTDCIIVFCGVKKFNFFSSVFCRWTLESLGALEPRQSALEEDFEEEEENEDNEQPADELEDKAHEKVLSFL